MKRIYALIDCDNFFVSCERIFKPQFNNKPVIVLSNNDGCVIARSREVKELGVGMAEPFYKVRDLVKKHDIKVFSPNFTLYSDISKRLMNVLNNFSSQVETYSIDEAFLDLTHLTLNGFVNNQQYGLSIRKAIKQWIGVPVSIGIAPTKTLAKIAGTIAKKHPEHNGVYDISSCTDFELEEILRSVTIGDVWGIGRNSARMLNIYGVNNAYDFIRMDQKWVRKNMGLGGWRVYMELKGTPVLEEGMSHTKRKSIILSRTFKGAVYQKDELKSYLSSFVSTACEKLREDDLCAKAVNVYLRGDYHKDNKYFNSHTVYFDLPTSYTPNLLTYVSECLEKIFVDGYPYKQMGVCLYDLTDSKKNQINMFANEKDIIKEHEVIQAVDDLNQKWGGIIKIAREVRDQTLYDVRHMMSQKYTTSWNELLSVRSS